MATLGNPTDHIADHMENPRNHKEIPTDHTETPRDHVKIPIDQLENHIDQMERPTDHMESSTDHMKIPLDRLEIPEDVDDPDWGERCSQKIVKLTEIPFVEAHPAPQIIANVFKAVRDDGDVDSFVNVLEEAYEENKLHLFSIWNQATPGGDTLLHVAAEFRREKIALLLAHHNPDLIIRENNRGDTPLHVASRAGNSKEIRVILFAYAQYGYPSYEPKPFHNKEDFISKPNKQGNTTLHEAVLSSDHEVVLLLLNVHSPDYRTVYWKGDCKISPIYLAVMIGNERILLCLLQIPLPRSQILPKGHGSSPLHAAILVRNSALLYLMIFKRQELMYLRDEKGDTPLHYAAYTGYEEGVRILIEKSALTAFERNLDGNLPIHLACRRGHVQVVKELLQLEYGPNRRIWLNNEGQTILHIAAMSGKNNVVKHLLRNDKIIYVMVNKRDINGDTPLHMASRKLCLWTLLLLLQDQWIDVDIINNEGLTARDTIWKQCKVPMTRQELLAEVILKRAGVPLKANMLGVPRAGSINEEWNLKDAANTLIVVAILIATVTFAAGFTIPGATYSSDEPDPKKRGMAILAHETLFKIFLVFNTIAMYSSTLGSVIIIWVQLGGRRFAVGAYQLAKHFVYVALITMSVAFIAAIRLIVSNSSLLADVITVIGSIFIFFIIFVRILGKYPLGIRRPLFRQVGELFIWIILILFYGRNDIVTEVVQVKQVDQNNNQHGEEGGQVNQVGQNISQQAQGYDIIDELVPLGIGLIPEQHFTM